MLHLQCLKGERRRVVLHAFHFEWRISSFSFSFYRPEPPCQHQPDYMMLLSFWAREEEAKESSNNSSSSMNPTRSSSCPNET